MSNVINMFTWEARQAVKKRKETTTKTDFKSIEKANKDKQERLKKERIENNKEVTKEYNLK